MPQSVQDAIGTVISILKILVEKGKLTREEQSAARSAWNAARSAAWSAANPANLASAERSAVWSAASAASAAASAAVKKQEKIFLKLLSAKVGKK